MYYSVTFQISRSISVSYNATVDGSLFSKQFTIIRIELSRRALTFLRAIFTIGKIVTW